MERLRKVIELHMRWSELLVYIERIETFQETDFSNALENAKALLETIGKEICSDRGVKLQDSSSVNGILKNAFGAIGYSKEELITQVSSSLATIGQHMGSLRNEVGVTSHGRTLDELKARNDKVDQFTKEFLVSSTSLVAAFLIRGFEAEHGKVEEHSDDVEDMLPPYNRCNDFNESWDDSFGEFQMGGYSFPASEILYNADGRAYLTEYEAYKAGE